MPTDEDKKEIKSCDDVQNAVKAYKASKESDPAEERYIIKKAVELGCSEHIPDDWGL